MSARRTASRPAARRAARPARAPATLVQLQREVIAFRDARDWAQFHNAKDACLSLALEAAELLELTQWKQGTELERHLRQRREDVADELSDVLYWVLLLAHDQGIDLATAFRRKLRKNARKYPVRRARGSSAKYARRRR